MLQSDTMKGLAIGLGVAAIAPLVASALFGASRPLARAAIKSGLILYEKGREAAAEFAEVVEDLVAEARAEVAHAHDGAVAEGAADAEVPAGAVIAPGQQAVRPSGAAPS
jgi:hypothetical protein